MSGRPKRGTAVDSKTETVQQVTVDEIVDRLEESGYATIPGAIAAHQVAWARSVLAASENQQA